MLGFPPPNAVYWPSRYDELLTLYDAVDGAWNLLPVEFWELILRLWRAGPSSSPDNLLLPRMFAPITLADLFFIEKLLYVIVFFTFGELFMFLVFGENFIFVSVSKSERFLGRGRRGFFGLGLSSVAPTLGLLLMKGWILFVKSVPVCSWVMILLRFSPRAVTAVSASPSLSVVR